MYFLFCFLMEGAFTSKLPLKLFWSSTGVWVELSTCPTPRTLEWAWGCPHPHPNIVVWVLSCCRSNPRPWGGCEVAPPLPGALPLPPPHGVGAPPRTPGELVPRSWGGGGVLAPTTGPSGRCGCPPLTGLLRWLLGCLASVPANLKSSTLKFPLQLL